MCCVVYDLQDVIIFVDLVIVIYFLVEMLLKVRCTTYMYMYLHVHTYMYMIHRNF